MDNFSGTTFTASFTNHSCAHCGTHYYGEKGQEKWFTPEEWEDYVNVVDGIDYRKPLTSPKTVI